MKMFLALAAMIVWLPILGAMDATARSAISVGIEAGPTMTMGTRTYFATVYGFAQKSESGFAGGAFIAFAPMKVLTIQPELMYVQKNVTDKQPSAGGSQESFRLRYIELPLLVKFSPAMLHGRLRPTIFAGPFLSFLLSAEATFEGFYNAEYNGEFDIKNRLNAQDLGVTFGGGLGCKVGNGVLFVNARYDFGLSNVESEIKDYNQNVGQGTWIRHLRSFIVMAGYQFDL